MFERRASRSAVRGCEDANNQNRDRRFMNHKNTEGLPLSLHNASRTMRPRRRWSDRIRGTPHGRTNGCEVVAWSSSGDLACVGARGGVRIVVAKVRLVIWLTVGCAF